MARRTMRAPVRSTTRRCLLLLALVLCALAAAGGGSALAAPGSLDASFGTGGLKTEQMSADGDAAHAVLVQPDGKFLAVGSSDPQTNWGGFGLVRYNANGTLDSSFGSGGKVVWPTGHDGEATCAALQADGKIVVGGTFWNSGASMEQFSFVRFNGDGSLDTSFGVAGVMQVQFGTTGDFLLGVAVDSQGRIVGTGISTSGPQSGYTGAQLATVRLTGAGALDNTFGTGGKVTTVLDGTSTFDKARAIAIDSSDRPVIVGDTHIAADNHDAFVFVRYTTLGALDTGFNGTGKRIENLAAGTHDDGRAVAIQPDGKILAAGVSNDEGRMAVVRLTSGGALDTSFNTTGKFETALSGFSSAGANAIRVQQNGRIVVGGFADNGSGAPRFAMIRVTGAGALDATFGSGGIVTTDVGAATEGAGWFCDQTAPQCPGIHGAGVLNDGDVIAAGAKIVSGNTDFQLARYDGDAPTLPTVSISAPANGSTIGSSATATFTTGTPSGVALKQTTCQLDSNAPAACSSGQAYSGLAPGSHTITVRATDLTGMTGSASTTFTTKPLPVVTITAPAEGATLAGTSTNVTFSIANTTTSVTCALDTGAASACTSPKAYSSLTPGPHYVTVVATNESGSDTEVVNFSVIDNTAPTAPTTVGASAITTTGATINWSGATDGVGVTGYEVFRDGATSLGTTAGTSLAVTGLACSTTYSITVKARDAAGNWSPASGAYSLTTATCPAPVVTISSPTANQAFAAATTSVNIAFSATGSPTAVTCKLDAGAASACTSGQTFSGLAQGPHSITVAASNVGGTGTATVNFRIVDNQAPTVPSGLATSNITQTGVRLTWTPSTDNVGVEQYNVMLVNTLGDVKWIGYTNTASVPMTQFDLPTNVDPGVTGAGLACGTQYWLRLTAEDAATDINGLPARNVSANSGDLEFFTLPCNASPTVTINSPVNNSTLAGYSTTVNFSATGYPASFTYTCKLDAAAATACASGQAYGPLDPGPHTVVVTATNTTGSGSATVNFTVPDISAPTVPAGLGTSAVTATGATLSWTASSDNVAVSGYDVYANGVLKGSTTSATSLAVTGLTCETAYALTVVARDAAGNASAASAPANVTTSTCPAPTVTITAPTAAQAFAGTTTSVNVAFTTGGAPTSITCKLDNGAAAPCTSGSAIAVATQGPHTITVTASNSGGSGSASVSFRIVDTVKPTVPTNLQVTNITETSARFSWTASTDNVGVEQYNVQLLTVGDSFWAGYTNTASPNMTQFDYPANRDGASDAPNLTCGTQYWFHVNAEDNATDINGAAARNYGDASGDKEFFTAPCPAAPVVTISSPANNATLAGDSTTIAFSATGVPSAITFTCKLDADAATACATGQSYSGLQPGAHTVVVTGTNTTGSGSATVNFTVPDLAAPSVPSGLSTSAISPTGATLSWAASVDNVAVTGYDVFVDGVLKGSTTSAVSFALTGLTCEQTYSLTVKAKDAAGNSSAASAALGLTTSTCPAPIVTITSPTAAQVFPGTTNSVNIAFTLAGAPTSVTCKLDNGAAVSCASGQSIAVPAQGPHTITVAATNSGGTGTATVSFRIIDTVAPSAPTGLTAVPAQTSAAFSWTASTDNVAVEQYDVFLLTATDSFWAGFTNTGSPNITQFNYPADRDPLSNAPNLTCGSQYWFRVVAEDNATNAAGAEARNFSPNSQDKEFFTLPCDAAPTVTISSPANNATLAGYSTTVNFSATGYPASFTYTCKLDASAAAACASGQAYGPLDPGPHTVVVTATNTTGSGSATVNFTVPDLDAPSVPTVLQTSAITPTGATLSWNASNDNVAVTAYDVFVDGALKGTAAGAPSFAVTGLTCETTYSLTVKAKDAAGNSSAASAPASLTTATCPAPVVTITSPTAAQVFAGTTTSVSTAFTILGTHTSVTCKLDSGAAAACASGQTFNGLAQGPHTITVAASSAGGTGTATVSFRIIDTAAPSKPAGLTVSNIAPSDQTPGATLSWAPSTDNVGVEQYDVFLINTQGEVKWVGYKNTASASMTQFVLPTDIDPVSTFAGLTCGATYWFRVIAADDNRDAAGNEARNFSPQSDDKVFSTSPCPATPVVTISSPANNAVLGGNSATVNFSVAAAPPASATTCKLDDAAAAACATGQVYGGLAPGQHTVVVSATNSLGTGSATTTFTVPDQTPPSAPTGVTNGAITGAGATIDWTASSDNVGVTGYELFANGGATPVGSTTGATSLVLSTLTCGTAYSITVKARDAAGNRSAASDPTAFTTSNCPAPTVTITGPSANQVLPGSATSIVAVFTVTGNPTSVTCKLDNGTPFACTSLQSISVPTQGPHILTVTATHNVWGSGGATVAFSINDTTMPGKATGLNFTDIQRTTAQLNWTAASDNLGVTGYDVYVGPTLAGSTSGATSLALTGLTCASNYNVTVRARDAAGNIGDPSATAVLTTAACPVPATVTITAPANNAVLPANELTVFFTTGNEPTAVTCKLDSGAAQPCSSPATFSSLVPGSHTVTVTASNALGANSDTRTITVPDVTAPSAPPNVAVSNIGEISATLSWDSATDDVGVTRYDVYNGAVKIGSVASNLPRSFDVTGLACQADFTLSVKAVDATGNESAGTAVPVRTDDCPLKPTVTITNSPAVTSGNDIHVEFTTASKVTSLTCQLDQAPAAACTNQTTAGGFITGGNVDFTGLSAGQHTITIAARNNNPLAGTATHTFTAPDITAPSAPAGLTASAVTATGFTVGWDASTDDVGVSGYDVKLGGAVAGSTAAGQRSFAFAGLTCASSYEVAVVARDAAGNSTSGQTASFSTGACPVPPPPGTGGGGADTTAQILSARNKFKPGAEIELKVGCGERCVIDAVVKLGKKTTRLKAITVGAGQTTVRVKLGKSLAKKIKTALKKRTKVTAVFTPRGGAPTTVKIK